MKISEALKCIISGYREHGKRLSHITYSYRFNPYRLCFGVGGGGRNFFVPCLFISKLRLPKAWSRNISVSIVTSYVLDNRRIVVRFSRVVKSFVFPLKCPDGFCSPSAFYSKRTEGSFPIGKADGA